MLLNTTTLVLSFSLLAQQTLARYTLAEDFSGHNFYSKFNFFTDSDPTHGFVSYQSLASSVKSGLAGYLVVETSTKGRRSSSSSSSSSIVPHVFLGVDYTNPANSSGRPSTRVTSKKSYNKGLLIADIAHMPTGICGVWPALWMVGRSWPQDGEIDIIEGVNQQSSNSVTLHTSAGCAVDNKTASFAGTLETPDCNVASTSQPTNAGCSISLPSSSKVFHNASSSSSSRSKLSGASFGPAFNAQGGGVFAMEWTSSGISVWFFPYSNSSSFSAAAAFPADLLSSSSSASPIPSIANWGEPAAAFAGSGCDFDARFQNLSIVVNTALCGDWAGQVWQSGGCAKSTGVATCDEYVARNPKAFTEAYWEIRSLRMYQEK
jgi:nicotinate-nucleotide pyrophosphorylase (carboxylating)